MSTPYGGNDPQQWGQQPSDGDAPVGPPSGGFPAQHQPGTGGFPAQGQQPGYGQQQPYPQQPYGQPQSGQQPYGKQQWGQQPPGYGYQQGGYPPYGQQPGYGQQQPGGAYPPSGPQAQQAAYPQGQQYQEAPYPQPGAYPGYGQQYGGGYPQYGQPPGYPTGPEEGTKSNLPLFIGLGVLVLLIAALAFLGFVAPGWFNTKVFDNNAVQSGVRQILEEQYQIEGVEGVSCPDGQQVEVGHTFECTATINGQPKPVLIKVTSEDGNYEVGKPAL